MPWRRSGATSSANTLGRTFPTWRSIPSIPAILPGNIENFIGVAQVPIGLAGPLRIQGEHAQGDFYVPLATSEGTLVASYNRGMRLLTECGGVKTTVVEQSHAARSRLLSSMTRSQAREFGSWVDENFECISQVPEATTRSGKLITSANIRWARCGTCVSTTPPVTRLART